jgi:hypothetical protein
MVDVGSVALCNADHYHLGISPGVRSRLSRGLVLVHTLANGKGD